MSEEISNVRDLILTIGGVVAFALCLRWVWSFRREMLKDRAAERAELEAAIEAKWSERADVAGRLADLERTFETAVLGWRRTRTRTRRLFDEHSGRLSNHATRLSDHDSRIHRLEVIARGGDPAHAGDHLHGHREHG